MLSWLKSRLVQSPAIGLHVSDEDVKFCRLGWDYGRRPALALGRMPLPDGAVINGEIRQPAVLALSVRSWLNSPAGRNFGVQRCRVALPEEQSLMRSITLPDLAPHEVGRAVHWEVEGLMPLKAEEISYRYELLPLAAAAPRHAIVTAFPKNIIGGYRRALALAGLRPVGFELESQALARAVIPRDAAILPRAIVDIGRRRTKVSISGRGAVHALTSLAIGCADFASAASTRDHLAGELNRIFWSYHDHPAAGGSVSRDVSTVYLTQESDVPGLVRFLTVALGRPVIPANPWVNIALAEGQVPPVPRSEVPRYATAIGLAMRAAA